MTVNLEPEPLKLSLYFFPDSGNVTNLWPTVYFWLILMFLLNKTINFFNKIFWMVVYIFDCCSITAWQSKTNDAELFWYQISKQETSETKEMCLIAVQCARHLCLRELCQLILSVRYLMHSISDMSRTSEKSHHKTLMALRGCKFQHDK